jgi:hypothetical protein
MELNVNAPEPLRSQQNTAVRLFGSYKAGVNMWTWGIKLNPDHSANGVKPLNVGALSDC